MQLTHRHQRWNRVGQLGHILSQFTNYPVWPGLYHVRREIYKLRSWSTTTATMRCKIRFVSHTHFLKQWYLLVTNAQEPHPSSFVHMHATIAIYNLLKATPIDLLLLQEFYPCSMLGNIHVQQIYSLHEVTSTHILVSASLQVATPTNPSRYLFAYSEYTMLSTCNALLVQFLSVFHILPIQITSG